MLKKKADTNHIEQRDLYKVAFDLGLAPSTDGLLVFRSDAEETKRILKYPFRTRHYSIIMLGKGKLRLRVNMFDYELTPGKIGVMSPSAIKEFKDVQDDTMLSVILFDESHILNASLPQLYNDFFSQFVTNSHFVIHTKSAQFIELKQLFDLIHRRVSNGAYDKTVNLMLFVLLNVTGECIAASDVQVRETKNKKADLVVRFFKLLPKNVSTERGVQFYANVLDVNEKYLTRTLREKTGRTARQLISEMVILEAKVLLSNPDYSIFQIADQLHFPDQFTFSKYFKKYSGMTPSRYREGAFEYIDRGRVS